MLACGDRTGTNAGYARHIRGKQTPCPPCVEAHRALQREERRLKPELVRARDKRSTERHKARRLAYGKKHYRENKERYREWSTRWAKENTARRREIALSWVKRNPGYGAERQRARKRATSVPLSVALIDQKMGYWGYRCWMCGGPFEHVDHVKPLSKGGPHILANLRPACAKCNISKSGRWSGPGETLNGGRFLERA